MGFFYQLRVLLWKNGTLKKRSLVLTASELLIPLVLVGILVFLRVQVETNPTDSAYNRATPLLSAGLVPTLQTFCPGGTKDEYDFINQQESIIDRTFMFLQDLQDAIIDFSPPISIGDIIDKLKNMTDPEGNNRTEIGERLQEIIEAIKDLEIPRPTAELLDDVVDDMDQSEEEIDPAETRSDSLPQQCAHGNISSTELPGTEETPPGIIDDLLRAWEIIQRVVCNPPKDGRDGSPIDGTSADFNPGGPGKPDPDDVMEMLKQLVTHMLSSNPKILYAPSGSDADDVIRNVLGALAVISDITEAAENWLKLSEIIDGIDIDLNITTPWADILEEDINHFEQSSPDRVNIRELFQTVVKLLDALACTWLRAVDSRIILGMADLFQGFESEAALEDYFQNKAYEDDVMVIASIVFTNVKNDGSLPPRASYKLRMNATFTATTQLIRPTLWHPRAQPISKLYYLLGFTWLQDLVDNAIIQYTVGQEVLEPGVYVEEVPMPCFRNDDFQLVIEYMMPLSLMLSWLFPVALLARSIVYEKELRLREMMKMMGLRGSALWSSWFIIALIQMSITMAAVTCMLILGHVLTYSNGVVIFLFMELYGLNAIFFGFFMSVLFSRAKIAAACAGIIFMMSYVPYMYISILESLGPSQPYWAKCITSMFGATALGLSGKFIAYFETSGQGLQWSNIHHSPLSDEKFSVLIAMIMMMVGIIVFFILTWYIDNVWPGPYGQPEPWYFPFTKNYWCRRTSSEDDDEETAQCDGIYCLYSKRSGIKCGIYKEEANKSETQMLNVQPAHFEGDPGELKQTITIDGLTKEFGPTKVAVNNLSMNLYEDQILSFLGHNGAGKTTTMSMLTGMLPVSSGNARIYGHNITSSMASIRKLLGMCPQHNILFDSMTVEEHLRFYAMMKGVAAVCIPSEIETLLSNLGLSLKRNAAVDTLSGGMKRKLSVGIAFIGGSKAVILDEPTAGVDPCSRRDIWDLLLKYKKGRTIMLSTHHMDEADVLGDRIAMISHGQLLCCGSSLFLKSTFGDGYHLRVVKKMEGFGEDIDEEEEEGEISESNEEDSEREGDMQAVALESAPPPPPSPSASACSSVSSGHGERDTESASLLIQSHVPGAYLKDQSARELHYVLPYRQLALGAFETVFSALDKHKTNFKIKSYGISDSTLEEVFIKVIGNAKVEAGEGARPEALKNGSEDTDVPLPSITSSAKYCRSLSAEEPGRSPQQGAAHRRRKSEYTVRKISAPPRSMRRSISWDNGTKRTYSRMDPLDEIAEGRQESEEDSSSFERVTGAWLALQQFYASFVKRMVFALRSWRWMAAQLIMPTLFVIIAMVAGSLGSPAMDAEPSLELSTTQYYNISKPKAHNYVPVSNQFRYNASLDATPEELMETFHLKSGIGAACVLNTPFPSDPENVDYASGCIMDDGSRSSSMTNEGASGSEQPRDPYTKPLSKGYYPDCQCTKDMRLLCTGDHDYPPSLKVVTEDILLDSSKQNETKYLLHTDEEYRLSRYGGLSFGNIRPHIPDWGLVFNWRLGNKIANRKVAKVWYHTHGFHSMPVFVNALNNAVLRGTLPENKGNRAAYGILTSNHPMKGTTSVHAMASSLAGSELVIAIFIVAGLAFVPAGYALFLVQENSSKAKHLQFVSGLHPAIYWCNNYLCDMLTYLAPATCCIIIFRIFDLAAFTAGANYAAVALLVLLFGFGCIPLMYPATFLFKEPSAAYVFLAVFNIFTGVVAMFITFVLDVFDDQSHLATASEILKKVFLIFPTFALGRGFMDVSLNHMMNEINALIGLPSDKSALSWDVTGKNLVALAAIGILSFIVTFLMEYNFFMKPKQVHDWQLPPCTDEDADVADERRRVARGQADDEVVKLHDLTKMYTTAKRGKHLAVDKLCLGIPGGECFGMLGINGAGKTTTFKMLTGDHSPSMGDAVIAGHSVISEINSVRQNIGYCPQFDALFDELDSREHLMLYARLRGIAKKDQKRVVEGAIRKLELSAHADKRSGTYSGGNKRKLSTAIALMGNPPVVFLDEPTAGMDPYAKRFLWDLVLGLIKDGKCIILTSHSMEECEALCNRLAIMVKGSFQCLGSVQHLKNKFGDGYTIKVTVKGPGYEEEAVQLLAYITEHLPEAVLKETHHKMLHFEIPSEEVCLPKVFACLQEAKNHLPIEDYAVCQNTLDNVFINFVKTCSSLCGEVPQADAGAAVSEPGGISTTHVELGTNNPAFAGVTIAEANSNTHL